MNKLQLICTILIVTCVCMCSGNSVCIPGNYHVGNYRCLPCTPGYYCPGDDNFHKCKYGTAQPLGGKSTCDVCPSGKSLLDREQCIIADIPDDFWEMNLKVKSLVPSFVERTNIVTHLQIPDDDIDTIISFGFQPKRPTHYPFSIYASFSTGNPNATKNDFAATGTVISLSISKKMFKKDVLYITIISNSGKTEIDDLHIITERNPGLLNLKLPTSTISTSGWYSYHLFQVSNMTFSGKARIDVESSSTDSCQLEWLFVQDDPKREYANALDYSTKKEARSDGKASLVALAVQQGKRLTIGTKVNDRCRLKYNFSITPIK